MGEHSREIQAGSPPPDMLVLARAGRLWRSKGKDSASKLGQSRRADHDFHPHACSVTVNNTRVPTGATLSTTRNSCTEGRRGALMIPGLPAAVTPAASLCPERRPNVGVGMQRAAADIRPGGYEQCERRGLSEPKRVQVRYEAQPCVDSPNEGVGDRRSDSRNRRER
jgi:hypothetical protein